MIALGSQLAMGLLMFQIEVLILNKYSNDAHILRITYACTALGAADIAIAPNYGITDPSPYIFTYVLHHAQVCGDLQKTIACVFLAP